MTEFDFSLKMFFVKKDICQLTAMETDLSNKYECRLGMAA